MSLSTSHADASARRHIDWIAVAHLLGAAVLIANQAFVAAHAATATPEAATAFFLPAAASLVSGVVLAGGAFVALMVLRERDGKTHWLTTKPFAQSAIPIAITSGLVFGVALLVTGVANFF